MEMKLIKYSHLVLTGKDCMIDELFVPHMDRLCLYALQEKLHLYINSSFREDLNVVGAIVEPAKRSNHLVGHAIDCNMVDVNGKMWHSGELLSADKELNIPEILLSFINKVRNDGILRYGGDFAKIDVVHFDDGLNIKNPALWKELYNKK